MCVSPFSLESEMTFLESATMWILFALSSNAAILSSPPILTSFYCQTKCEASIHLAYPFIETLASYTASSFNAKQLI